MPYKKKHTVNFKYIFFGIIVIINSGYYPEVPTLGWECPLVPSKKNKSELSDGRVVIAPGLYVYCTGRVCALRNEKEKKQKRRTHARQFVRVIHVRPKLALSCRVRCRWTRAPFHLHRFRPVRSPVIIIALYHPVVVAGNTKKRITLPALIVIIRRVVPLRTGGATPRSASGLPFELSRPSLRYVWSALWPPRTTACDNSFWSKSARLTSPTRSRAAKPVVSQRAQLLNGNINFACYLPVWRRSGRASYVYGRFIRFRAIAKHTINRTAMLRSGNTHRLRFRSSANRKLWKLVYTQTRNHTFMTCTVLERTKRKLVKDTHFRKTQRIASYGGEKKCRVQNNHRDIITVK